MQQCKHTFNPLNAKLNPICHLLALTRAHPILHVSRIRVNMTVYSVSLRFAQSWKVLFARSHTDHNYFHQCVVSALWV